MSERTQTPTVTGRVARLAPIVFLAACAPSIYKLEVRPRHICPDEEVKLVWKFTGSGTITTTPPIPGAPNGSVEDSGTATFKPRVTMKIKLHVTRTLRAPANAQDDVEIEPGTEVSASLALPTATWAHGIVTSTASMTSFDGLAVVAVGVAAGNQRASFDIARVDPRATPSSVPVVAHVIPDHLSRAFAGMPVNGTWLISSPLIGDETCDGDPPRLPNNLIVKAYTSCQAGRQP